MYDPQSHSLSLQEAFRTEQESLAHQLRSSNRIAHNGDKGEVNEEHFIEFLRTHLPNRYCVEKAIVLDSTGTVSHSIDIVVFDRQYTPTLLDNKKHRYVPAEAVYAVFECKPCIDKGYLEYAAEKAKSVRQLHRTSVQIHHAGSKPYAPKEPGYIIAGILALDTSWSGGLGKAFHECHSALTGDKHIDCGLAVSGGYFDSYDTKLTFGPIENSLAFFTFRLLSRLQSLGTAPAADWSAYATKLTEQQASYV